MASGTGQRTLAELRKRILDGSYAPGTRLTELGVSEELGVSRTPIRIAFSALEREGYLDPAGARGYSVRKVSFEDVCKAIEMRGVLEGEAAAQLARNGTPAEAKELLTKIVNSTARLFQKGTINQDTAAKYSTLNEQFHATLISATGSTQLITSVQRLNHLPLGSIRSINFRPEETQAEFLRLLIGHTHHAIVLRAIMEGDARRAEAVMREHAFVRIDYEPLLKDLIGDGRSDPNTRKIAADALKAQSD